jgi:cytochrome b involved in lipid metabolism
MAVEDVAAEGEKSGITMAELEQHTNKDSCWLAIHGKVYDVTKYLDDHPGGNDVLIDASGRDATEDFEDVGHSKPAITMMAKYLIGEFAGGSAHVAKAGKGGSGGGVSVLLQFLVPILIAFMVIAVNNGWIGDPLELLQSKAK